MNPNKIFINLSNHPSATWSAEQMLAAQKLGKVVDMKFPDVSAGASREEVEELARETAQKILAEYPADSTRLTVHVMGEMTFTYALVSILKGCGVRCVASCTWRDTQDLGNGQKVSQFHFTQFRDY